LSNHPTEPTVLVARHGALLAGRVDFPAIWQGLCIRTRVDRAIHRVDGIACHRDRISRFRRGEEFTSQFGIDLWQNVCRSCKGSVVILPNHRQLPNLVKSGENMRQILTLPGRPTAVFASNNLLSLGALLAINEMGLRCPEEIALVGFDDHPWAAISDPPLTVVRQPAQQLGQVATQMLLTLINGEQLPEPRVILDCKLILRQSHCLVA